MWVLPSPQSVIRLCGFSPLTAQTRNPFSISFYLVALLFLIFDLEIALVYPVAVSLNAVGNYGF